MQNTETKEERRKRLRRESDKRYYTKNRVAHRERTQTWRKNNPAKGREYGRKWRAANLEKSRAYARRWKSENLEHVRLAQYKANARDRDIEWSLADEEAISCFRSDCYYCGSKPDPLNGIDRVDNIKGYLSNNTVPACNICNVAKQELSLNSFLDHCAKILNNFNDL